MTDIRICFGPPGTGKTTKLLRECEELTQKKGLMPEELVYVTFQKKAAEDAAKRGGIADLEEKQFKTLHGLCYGLIGGVRAGRVLGGKEMREFAKQTGVEFVFERLSDEGDELITPDEGVVDRKATRHIATYNLSRQLCKTSQELDLVRQNPHPEAAGQMSVLPVDPEYTTFIGKYERWKQSEGLLDFTDMLERAFRNPLTFFPRWKHAFVDEAQDLSPLQLGVAKRLFFNRPEQVTFAGDDFQTIMQFQGARVADFLALRAIAKIEHLEQTHRFGAEMVRFCAAIAERIELKESKTIIPKANAPGTIDFEDRFDPSALTGETLLLHRHKLGCLGAAKMLIRAGIPFWNERGLNPLGRKEVAGYRAFDKLKKTRCVTGDELESLLEVVPAFREKDGTRLWTMKYGAKAELQRKIKNGQGRFTTVELSQAMTSEFWTALANGDWSVTNIAHPAYYERLEAQGWKLNGRKRPDVTVTTIHGSKGREAENVVLFTEMMNKLTEEPDEHHVAYVGASRAKTSLTIIREHVVGRRSMSDYVYPETAPSVLSAPPEIVE